MENLLIFIAFGLLKFVYSEYVILPENFTSFIINSPEEVKKYFFDNHLVAVDNFPQIQPPPANCLSAGIENPSLLIYCVILALIWLATVCTGLFFYFRAIFQKLSNISPPKTVDIELNPLSKNELKTNRAIIMGK